MVEWKTVAEHPQIGDAAPRVLVWGKRTGVEMGRVFHYPDGLLNPRAEGYHGEWGITHYADIPAPPSDAERGAG